MTAAHYTSILENQMRKNTRLLGAILLLTVVCQVGWVRLDDASANPTLDCLAKAVSVDHPWTGTFNGATSSVGAGQQVADDFFMPKTAVVVSLKWLGIGINGNLNGITNERFQIRLYLDTQVPPGQASKLNHSPALLPFYVDNVAATLTYAGKFIVDDVGRTLQLFSYAATLQVPVLLNENVTYWLSILGNDTTEFDWAEAGIGADVFRPGLQGDGTAWLEDSTEVDRAFTLAGVQFDGAPGRANCYPESVSGLARQCGGQNNAAAVLGLSGVPALHDAIRTFCGE